MRYSRIVRLVMRLFLLLLASTMSFISFLGGYSALLILGDKDNIDLDVDFDGNPIADPLNFEVQIKFEINNQGYFDLEDLKIELELWMDYNILGNPIAEEIKIYDDDKTFSTIEAGKKKENKITIDYETLEAINWTDLGLNIDTNKDIRFIARNVEISAKYSLGLIAFNVEIKKIELDTYDV